MEYRCRRRCRSVYVYICSRFPLLSWVFWWVAGATCLARALGTPPHQWTGPVKNAWWSKVGGCAMLQVIAAQHKSTNYVQWEFQDPKMEVLYHIRPYFGGIFPYIGLIYGRYLQFRFLEWPLICGGFRKWGWAIHFKRIFPKKNHPAIGIPQIKWKPPGVGFPEIFSWTRHLWRDLFRKSRCFHHSLSPRFLTYAVIVSIYIIQ